MPNPIRNYLATTTGEHETHFFVSLAWPSKLFPLTKGHGKMVSRQLLCFYFIYIYKICIFIMYIYIYTLNCSVMFDSLVYVCMCVWLFVTLWSVARQTPLSMGISRKEYWSGLPFPSPGYVCTYVSGSDSVSWSIWDRQCVTLASLKLWHTCLVAPWHVGS